MLISMQNHTRRKGTFAVLVIAGLVLSGCSAGGAMRGLLGGGDGDGGGISGFFGGKKGGALAPDLTASDDSSVAGLYNDGLKSLNDGSYSRAQKKFADVERKHPYSKWATKSILMQAFAAYQRNAYDDAVNASQRFISLHPGHKDAAYAYYLSAISEYERIADVRRDQSRTEKAVDALDEVSQRFPDSPYAADAQKKAAVARNHLAAKEMEVGRYYLNKGSYLAGINRFKKVIVDYQTSPHTAEALYRLAEGYMALGVTSEAQTAVAVLGHNYPNSDWYQDGYRLVSSDGKAPQANNESWISQAFRRANPFSG